MSVLRLDPKPASEVLYERGSIVVCYACGVPIYRLEASIYAGEPMARSAWKYVPVGVADLTALMERRDLDAGQIAMFRSRTLQDWQTHCERITRIKAGDMADCPSCKQSFVYAETRASDDGVPSFADRGYLVKIAIIPPAGKARVLR